MNNNNQTPEKKEKEFRRMLQRRTTSELNMILSDLKKYNNDHQIKNNENNYIEICEQVLKNKLNGRYHRIKNTIKQGIAEGKSVEDIRGCIAADNFITEEEIKAIMMYHVGS